MACIAFLTASRRIANCVPTYCPLRRDVLPAASPRSSGGIGRTVTSCGGYLKDRRKGENVKVNVNLICFFMSPEGEESAIVHYRYSRNSCYYYIYNKVRARGLNFIHNIL